MSNEAKTVEEIVNDLIKFTVSVEQAVNELSDVIGSKHCHKIEQCLKSLLKRHDSLDDCIKSLTKLR